MSLASRSPSASPHGPPAADLGGLVLEYFWWGAVFLLGVPAILLLLLLGPILLAEYRDPEPGRGQDRNWRRRQQRRLHLRSLRSPRRQPE